MPQMVVFSSLMPKNRFSTVAAIALAIGSATAFGQLTGATQPAGGLTLSLPPAATAPAAEPTLTLHNTPAATAPAVPAPVAPAVPHPAPAVPAPAAPAPHAPAATAPASATQPFVGVVSHDRVYVRSGPGVNYYELGQLTRGDTVEVVGSKNGWYAIDPPVGTLCYVAKDLVEVEAGGQTGTVKGEFVNIRAASLIHPVSDYVVLTVAKKGTKINIEGSVDKYYKISPPEGVHVYISTQLVSAAPEGTAYSSPTLKLPTNYSTAPTTQPGATTAPAGAGGLDNVISATQPGTGGPVTIVVTPHPAVTFNSEARAKFAEVNNRTQAEFVKPILQEDLTGLLAQYKAILALPDLPPSVKQSSEGRIALVEKRLELQEIAKSATAPEPPAQLAEQKALQQTWEQAQKQIADAELNAPYVAEGELRTSEALQAKYVLVNPTTERVVAYVDPAVSDIDVSPLLGRYIGVKGKVEITGGVKLVHARTATLMNAPK